MRKLLLAGVALAAAATYLPTAAFAQAPTVFPTTSRAGKLDGAAPGSVQISLGGTFFSGILFEGGSNNSGDAKKQTPNLLNYFRLYPNMNYASPSGINYGVSAEIRANGAAEGKGRNTNTLYWHSAVGYVLSPVFGKISFGTPNDAIDQLGVGTGDDFGTGGFYSEYGWPNAPVFLAADSYDGDSPKQKISYVSPSFAGFTLGLSYQPTSVGMNNSSSLTEDNPGGQSKDRVEVALQFSHTFGPVALQADVGYGTATAAGGTVGVNYRDVNILNVGAVATIAGVEIEGSVITGNYSSSYNDSGSPFGPEIRGQKKTTAYTIGVGYSIGALAFGANYYGVDFDGADAGAYGLGTKAIGSSGTVSGESLGASYQVGPGVALYLDAITNENKASGEKVHGNAIGIGGHIVW